MRYFFEVHAQCGENDEVNFFIHNFQEDTPECGDFLSENSEDPPKLTIEMVKNESAYGKFEGEKKPKIVMVDYRVYQTENNFTKIPLVTLGEHFQMLIDNNQAEKFASGELSIEYARRGKPIIIKKKKRNKISPIFFVLCGFSVIFALIIGISLGKNMSGGADGNATATQVNSHGGDIGDGLIIPEQSEINPDSEYITLTIDRSYSAIPLEDLQIKGEILKDSGGKAVIQLPSFDKTDFFSHVAGYTWGFSTFPNAEKIEYYGGEIYSFSKDVKLYRVLVKYGGGNGTKEDPYIIDYFDQLELLAKEKARGYFKQTANLIFPEWLAHTPISTVNELKNEPNLEFFEYDGGGYKIEGLTAPLFEKVSGSVIKNVNIVGSIINMAQYKNYGFLVCEAYNYHYEIDNEIYETGETLIKNCTVSHSTLNAKYPKSEIETVPAETEPIYIPPDLELPDDVTFEPQKHGEFMVGGISGLGGQIENCYVTDIGLNADLDDYFLYAGGISGKPANVVDSGVFHVAIRGKIFSAGGIAGCAGGARTYDAAGRELPNFYGGNIQGCFVRNLIAETELAAGGIAGEGGTNAENALISNCYSSELKFTVGEFEDEKKTVMKKEGITGGIIAADGAEEYGHIVINTVSAVEFPIIGKAVNSVFDGTVRLAPEHAFSQSTILTVLNKNSVHPNCPKEIFTGSFMFADDDRFSNSEYGKMPYTAEISGLFAKTDIDDKIKK